MSAQRAAQPTRLVIKVGSSVLTDAQGRLVPGRLDQLVQQLADCMRGPGNAEGSARHPLLVSSGAIACGMAKLGLRKRPAALAQLQACAAIGQSELMHRYIKALDRHGLTAAQVLLTQDDLADRTRFRNAKQTLLTLLHKRAVPIVNENDTVSVEEITFGDNDRLAALVATAVDAELLVILSDVDGFLREGRVVERIEGLDESHDAAVFGGVRATTKGGMASKLAAARIVGHNGIPMVIANGTRPGALSEILAGRPVGTLFVPPRSRLTAQQWWIAFSLRQPKGAVVIDAGAARALTAQGKSLLAAGVVEVRGRFDAGAFVVLVDQQGGELGRGQCNFSAAELARIRGMSSAQAAKALGRPRATEVVHRDRLVLAEALR